MYNRKKNNSGEVPQLVLPQSGQVVGVVIKSLGATKFDVFCSDKKVRRCAIPGRLKRRFWIKENDLVLVTPWPVQGDEKGDVVWRYSIMDRDLLKKKGFEIPK